MKTSLWVRSTDQWSDLGKSHDHKLRRAPTGHTSLTQISKQVRAVLGEKMDGNVLYHLLLLLLCIRLGKCNQQAFQKASSSGEICKENICKFVLTLREELSMTRTIRPGRIWTSGETFLLQLENGRLIQRLGTFYQQKVYNDYDGLVVNATTDTITADGVRRSLITINGQFPGPMLEVMEGSEVEVIVNNQMLHKSATVHWHGFHQHNTPWMDGVAYITQCPISPMTSFMYRFIASPAGTLWYHAHLGGLRADGLFGLFIVHEKPPTIPFYPFVVNHWLHLPFNEYMITNPYKKTNQGAIAGSAEYTYSFEHLHMEKPRAWRTIDGVRLSSMVYTSTLINGRGQYKNNKAPLPWFQVEEKSWFGFYILNPGVEYTFAVSIDQHQMVIVDLGVGKIKPVTVDVVYLNPGERVRVKVHANKHVGNYWVRSRTLDDQGEALAVLHYRGAGNNEPYSLPKLCTDLVPCIIFNCPASAFPDESKVCKSPHGFTGIGRARELAEKVKNVDVQVFLDFAFPIGASINGFRFVLPKNHLYSDVPLDTKCSRANCKGKACWCTHYIDLPYKKTVQMVLANYGDKSKDHGHHHTIHLHGYDFVVLKTGFPEFDQSTGEMIRKNSDLYCIDKLCRKMRWSNYTDVVKTFNFENPPIQDAVLLPYGGYTVVRIRTENPGKWLMHCHQMMHAIEGMDVVIRVAPEKAPSLPKNFPKYCGGFTISSEEFHRIIRNKD
ncbi:uncharacterized protein LOC135682090 [Rhopilema esculentum]|uniref:uncharacterized protein LOC135682090 n=1 Tax=Rhopilema esculentum TaxID=499914 RepID=UPI0031E1A559